MSDLLSAVVVAIAGAMVLLVALLIVVDGWFIRALAAYERRTDKIRITVEQRR